MDPPRLGRGTLCPGSACREPVCVCGDAVETSAGPPGDGRAPHPGARSGGAGTHLGLRGVAGLLLEGRALGQRGAVVLVAEVLVGVVQPAGARPGRGPGDGTPVSPASWPAPGLVAAASRGKPCTASGTVSVPSEQFPGRPQLPGMPGGAGGPPRPGPYP